MKKRDQRNARAAYLDPGNISIAADLNVATLDDRAAGLVEQLVGPL
jgi:hypothetical protein